MAIIFRYARVKTPDDVLRKAPFIPVYLHDKNDKLLVFNALIDSGADNTVVPKDLAEVLGLTEKDSLETGGIGGSVKVKKSNLRMTIKGLHEAYTLSLPVLVLQNQGNVPLLLGRNGFFEHFHITFRQNEEKILLKKIKPK